MKLYDLKDVLSYPVWINENDDCFVVSSVDDLEKQAVNADIVYITSDGEGLVTIETSTLPAWRVCFIDGHDLHYKEYVTRGADIQEAIDNTYSEYGRSFDHSITSVTRI